MSSAFSQSHAVLHLDPNILDAWRSSAESFQEDLLVQSYALAKAVGLKFEFNQSALRAAHHEWVGNCGEWEAQHKAEGSDGLSHLKILALLLHNLAAHPWVRPDTVERYERRESDLEFNGTPGQRKTVRQNIIDGEGVCLALEFVFYCLNWFEHRRIDRLGPFEFRLTRALKHDLMVFLSGSGSSGAAVYLILKALYARHPKPEYLHAVD